MQHSWVLHSTSGLTCMHSKCYNAKFSTLQYHTLLDICTMGIQQLQQTRYSMLLLCFTHNPAKHHCFFLSNWISKFSGPALTKDNQSLNIEIFMWKYEESLNGCFVYSPFPPRPPNAKLKFPSVLNSQYKVFLISIYCWSDGLTEQNCWSNIS